MLRSTDSRQTRVSAVQCHTPLLPVPVYNSPRGDLFFLSFPLTVNGFQLIAGLGAKLVQEIGIQFATCLWKKFNYLKRAFLKRPNKSFAFALG